ncbi:MAG TPA: ArsI/CadI family heavy metal resistance metalloenzyme [Terriglobia bacterium]|nr:ArsI/CadI family heavy metal resistance metalloenzyme [Terriglobia bacterium]
MLDIFALTYMYEDGYVREYRYVGGSMDNSIRILKPHVALNVRSVEASLAFYSRLFGIDPVKVRPGYAKFDVQQPSLNLSLNESAESHRGGLSHLGIQVASTEDVLAIRRQWIEAGLNPRDEMQTNCCYAIQDKTWVTDPDGNAWEAFVVLKDNLTESSACCGTPDSTLVSIGTLTAPAQR